MLKVKDFLGLPDREITLSPGITLLKGPSGVGKTSLLRAILFVLYGERSRALGPTVVEFVFEGWRIRRQKSPERLQVYSPTGVYSEDVVAQSEIDKLFGNRNRFFVSGIVKQKRFNELLELPRAERVTRLESLFDLELPTVQFREWMSNTKTKLSTQLKTVENNIALLPLNVLHPEHIRTPEHQASLQTTLDALSSQVPVLAEHWGKWQSYIDNKSRLANNLPPPETEPPNITITEDYSSKIRLAEQHLLRQKWERDFSYYSQVPDLTLQEEQENQARLTRDTRLLSYTSYLPMPPGNPLHEWVMARRNEWMIYNADSEKRKGWEDRLTKLGSLPTESQLASMQLADTVLFCPGCRMRLALQDSQLIPLTGVPVNRTKQAQIMVSAKEAASLKTLLATTPPLKPSIPFEIINNLSSIDLRSPKAQYTQDELLLISKRRTLRKNEVAALPSSLVPTLSIKEMQELMITEEAAVREWQRWKKNDTTRQVILQQLANLTPVEQPSQSVLQLQTRISILFEELNNAKEYDKEAKRHDYHGRLCVSRDEHITHLNALEYLSSAVARAEQQALLSSLSILNQWLSQICPRLFDERVSLQLVTNSDNKRNKNRTGLDLQIHFGDRVVDSIDDISTGQGDRLSLALTLAFNRLMSTPILLLDEVASLDERNRTRMIELLKEIGPPHTVFVQHLISGDEFDFCIQFSNTTLGE
jgi:DNA repair exonuclease SbcCD ATPase subunit